MGEQLTEEVSQLTKTGRGTECWIHITIRLSTAKPGASLQTAPYRQQPERKPTEARSACLRSESARSVFPWTNREPKATVLPATEVSLTGRNPLKLHDW